MKRLWSILFCFMLLLSVTACTNGGREQSAYKDEPINTDAGDLILYQGNSFVIYYGTNSWDLTRLGKINNVTKPLPLRTECDLSLQST